MKSWKKGLMVIGLLLGLNVAIIPSVLPLLFNRAELVSIVEENPNIWSAMNESVPAIGADYV